jgi:phosphoribosylformylglycinamidine (FGAM) synthase-like enzyme
VIASAVEHVTTDSVAAVVGTWVVVVVLEVDVVVVLVVELEVVVELRAAVSELEGELEQLLSRSAAGTVINAPNRAARESLLSTFDLRVHRQRVQQLGKALTGLGPPGRDVLGRHLVGYISL